MAEDKINIVNYLLTRRCNLKCDFCGIVRNCENKPKEYPDIKHYYNYESKTTEVMEFLRKLKLHNPDAFVIWYGGEPFLRDDLNIIISYCNKLNINYTIISNNAKSITDKIEKFVNEIDYVQGFTASVDPSILNKSSKVGHRELKSAAAFESFLKYKGKIKDLVGEITVTNNDLHHLYDLVKYLTDIGVNSDITFVDIAKNPYYDFSNTTDDNLLVYKSPQLREIFSRIIDEKLNVHMRSTLLPMIYDILPADLDCKIEDKLHNICVDADGSLRLCLRIRGVQTPINFSIDNCFERDGTVNEQLKHFIGEDKRRLCMKCNHTCYLMSQIDNVDDLIHKDIRST